MALQGGRLVVKEEIYDYIWQVWQKEKRSSELQDIPKEFYSEAFEGLSKIKDHETYENLSSLMQQIFNIRKKKIMMYVAHEQPIKDTVPYSEQVFYQKLSDIYQNEKLNDLAGEKVLTLIVQQELPKIILPSGTEFGPVEKGQSISIKDKDDREFLIANNICKEA